jgi:hypothetical protein
MDGHHQLLRCGHGERGDSHGAVAGVRLGQGSLKPVYNRLPDLGNQGALAAARLAGHLVQAHRIVGHAVILPALPDIEAKPTRGY